MAQAAQQLTTEQIEELAQIAHNSRREVKRLAGQVRRTVRSLAQLEDVCQELGIELDTTHIRKEQE